MPRKSDIAAGVAAFGIAGLVVLLFAILVFGVLGFVVVAALAAFGVVSGITFGKVAAAAGILFVLKVILTGLVVRD